MVQPDADEQGGEQACWLNLVCDVCGALNDRDAAVCWRCDIPAQVAGKPQA